MSTSRFASSNALVSALSMWPKAVATMTSSLCVSDGQKDFFLNVIGERGWRAHVVDVPAQVE
jgi:hypothetical protein